MNRNPIVLIVDDDPHIRVHLKAILEKQSLVVVEAENGEQALNHIDNIKPDLVLLDIQMPVTDGRDTLMEIRRKYNKDEMPVVMITADKAPVTFQQFVMLGCQGYIVKPIKQDALMPKIDAILNRPLPSGRTRMHEKSKIMADELLQRLSPIYDKLFLTMVANLLLIQYASQEIAPQIMEARLTDSILNELAKIIRIDESRENIIQGVSRTLDADAKDFMDDYIRQARREALRVAKDKVLFNQFITAYIYHK